MPILGIIASAFKVAGLNMWIICGNGDYGANYSYSTDNGATWTTGNFGGTQNSIGTKFGAGVWSSHGSMGVRYSSDGTSWSAGSGSSGGYGMWFGGTIFIANNSGNTTTAASSTDGITWTARTFAVTQEGHGGTLAYGNGTFVASNGNHSSNTFNYSTNGTSWSSATVTSTGTFYSCGFGNGAFVAARISSSNVATSSTDGITWTARTLANTGDHLCVAGSDTKIVVFNYASTNASQSTDSGATWSTTTLPSAGNWLISLYANGYFMTAAATGPGVATSPDGTTWTARTQSLSVGTTRNIGFG